METKYFSLFGGKSKKQGIIIHVWDKTVNKVQLFWLKEKSLFKWEVKVMKLWNVKIPKTMVKYGIVLTELSKLLKEVSICGAP